MSTQRPLYPHDLNCLCADCVEAHCQRIAVSCHADLADVRSAVAVSIADEYSAWPKKHAPGSMQTNELQHPGRRTPGEKETADA